MKITRPVAPNIINLKVHSLWILVMFKEVFGITEAWFDKLIEWLFFFLMLILGFTALTNEPINVTHLIYFNNLVHEKKSHYITMINTFFVSWAVKTNFDSAASIIRGKRCTFWPLKKHPTDVTNWEKGLNSFKTLTTLMGDTHFPTQRQEWFHSPVWLWALYEKAEQKSLSRSSSVTGNSFSCVDVDLILIHLQGDIYEQQHKPLQISN